ncbi:hypothetical protein N1028_08045 [Herbiconiux sp. CPCC 203407]|uniref:Uncharacterized protein n=1 Tax=Herbiconiux oxytropis TaxID=2970915 RepID=A0AA41XCV2_9MICO|nr:hypothetical protein [Herbiconiux oxytropis]MCS5722893.1 hypothetical protein [Herbiconiux oxytropis]MCS5725847.1 hypothetical protein [Herbiconiux oxytropis]
MPDYTTLPALQHYVLEYSCVLGIVAKPNILQVEIDLSFARDHPNLRPPREGEVTYYRRGVIEFRGVTSLTWNGQGVPPAINADGEHDWGAMDEFTFQDDNYRLAGDFGDIQVVASSVGVRFIGPV